MATYHYWQQSDDLYVIIDSDQPNWFATNTTGKHLFERWQRIKSESGLIQWYHQIYNVDFAKAYVVVSDFLQKLRRIQMNKSYADGMYQGRDHYLSLNKLSEFWIHTNNSCNLACLHCLVNSGPKEDKGQDIETLKGWVDQAVELGTEQFYFTGGEPFYRTDIISLIDHVIRFHKKELVIITNGILFDETMITQLKTLPLERLHLQISLDGVNPKTNDAIRGRRSFEGAVAGIKAVQELGIDLALTTVVHPGNLDEVEQMPTLAKKLGVPAIHLMWPHLRGRFLREKEWNQKLSQMKSIVFRTLTNAKELGIVLDNYESIKWRVNGKPQVKFDLSGSGWNSLCVYSDGNVYPSAAFANHPELNCGSLLKENLGTLWKQNDVLESLRSATLANKEELTHDPLRFFLGGGDIEHSFFYSDKTDINERFISSDPYYPIYEMLAKEAFKDLAESKSMNLKNLKKDEPRIYHAMGEGAIACGSAGMAEGLDEPVATLHSNCVLGFDVEKPRQLVQEFYGDAADVPQSELCCPVPMAKDDILHIPKDVIDRFYGCGSPVSDAHIQKNETMVDLGSGAGIDCFIAAKKVGAGGKVIGVDMTDRMLSVAHENKSKVADKLGYDVVDFREGFLEKIPVDDLSVDLVTSNCVVNLSTDKKEVFNEIWRILKVGGRFIISDIVSEENVPVDMKVNPILWGECISGSLTQEELITFLEERGFHGLEIMKRMFWKEVNGHKFYSVTFRGYKYERPTGECKYNGQKVTYMGPFKGVTDEEGHYFPRNLAVDVCTDTFSKLSVGSLKEYFLFDENTSKKLPVEFNYGSALFPRANESASCRPDTGCC